MDNITHTLMGAAIGSTVAPRTRRAPVIVASVLANNFPDADLFYVPFLSSPFGYLLHHRGHTHTLLGVVLCGVLVALIVAGWCSWRGAPLGRDAWWRVFGVAVAGAGVHVGLDSLNSYGVHPWWPFSSGWWYGDTLAIIEPMLWCTLACGVASVASSVWWRRVCWAIGALGIALMVLLHRVPPQMVVVNVVVLICVVVATWRLSSGARATTWYGAAACIVVCFAVGRVCAGGTTRAAGEVMAFVSPSPANPLCWTKIAASIEGDEMVYTRRQLQLLASVVDLQCERYALSSSLEGATEMRLSLAQLQRAGEGCRMRAFLQFSRAPAIVPCEEGSCTTDLRFMRDAGRKNFTTIPLEGECPTALPPWKAPFPL